MNARQLLFTLFLLPTFNVSSQEDGFTFEVDDVTPASTKLNETTFDVFAKNRFSKQVYAFPEEFKGKSIVAHFGNGFLKTVEYAYNDHRLLELTPDAIWLVICQSFAEHVAVNPDSLEYLLLKEDHPESITIRNDSLTQSDDQQWSKVMASFNKEIDKISTDAFKNLIVQEFSTTTPSIRTVYQATQMDVVSNYTKFNVVTMCGFPSITLLGTPEDWQKIYDQLDEFSQFGLTHWVEELKPVLHEFILASKREPNIDFWKSFYKSAEVYDVDVISGWILKFYPYLRETDRGVDRFVPNPYLEGKNYLLSEIGDESLSKGTRRCKIEWYRPFDSIGQETLNLYSGFYGILQDEGTGAVRPNITWVLTADESDNQSRQIDYDIFRQKEFEYKSNSFVPGFVSDAQVKPIYRPDINDSFEDGVQSISKSLHRSGLFDKSDRPKIKVIIGYDGTVIIKSIAGTTEEQEHFIRDFLESTNGEWSPAYHRFHDRVYGDLIPVNFIFLLKISFS